MSSELQDWIKLSSHYLFKFTKSNIKLLKMIGWQIWREPKFWCVSCVRTSKSPFSQTSFISKNILYEIHDMQFTHSTKNKLEFRLELESLYGTIKVALLCFAFFHQSSVSLSVCLFLSSQSPTVVWVFVGMTSLMTHSSKEVISFQHVK